jgi:hypothetical protein
MLSERKLLLRSAEVIALFSIIGALYLGIKTYQYQNADFPVFPVATAGMALLMLTFLPACMLGGEYVKTVRKPSSWRQRTAGLSSRELAAILRWSPKLYLLIAAVGIIMMVVTSIQFGRISFRSNETPDPNMVSGIFFSLIFFYALALPVLGSASRMPGTYASQSDA